MACFPGLKRAYSFAFCTRLTRAAQDCLPGVEKDKELVQRKKEDCMESLGSLTTNVLLPKQVRPYACSLSTTNQRSIRDCELGNLPTE